SMQSIVRSSPGGGVLGSMPSVVKIRSFPEPSTYLTHGILPRFGSEAMYETAFFGSVCQCVPVDEPSGNVPPTLTISTLVDGVTASSSPKWERTTSLSACSLCGQ